MAQRLGFAGVYGANSTPIPIPLTYRPKPQLYSLRTLTLTDSVAEMHRNIKVLS